MRKKPQRYICKAWHNSLTMTNFSIRFARASLSMKMKRKKMLKTQPKLESAGSASDGKSEKRRLNLTKKILI